MKKFLILQKNVPFFEFWSIQMFFSNNKLSFELFPFFGRTEENQKLESRHVLPSRVRASVFVYFDENERNVLLCDVCKNKLEAVFLHNGRVDRLALHAHTEWHSSRIRREKMTIMKFHVCCLADNWTLLNEETEESLTAISTYLISERITFYTVIHYSSP